MAFLHRVGGRLVAKLCFSAVLAFLAGTAGAAPVYSFTHFNTANSDLSYDGISKITQDSRGFIWIGTFNGLNRYDGKRFDVWYRDDLGLESDFIHAILEDRHGNIWVGTDSGICRYIVAEDRFEPFTMESDRGTTVQNKVTYLYCDRKGRIWIIANYQGVFCYDPAEKTLRNWSDSAEVSGPPYNVDNLEISFRRMTEDGRGGFWISRYHGGVFRSNAEFTEIYPIEPVNAPDYYKGDEAEQLFYIDSKLVVVSNRHGVSRYDPMEKTVEDIFPMPAGAALVDAFLEKGRFVWLSTTDGIWCFDLHREMQPLCLRPQENDSFSLRGNYVFTSFVDRDSGLWIGTKDGGVSWSSALHRNFLKAYVNDASLLENAIVTGIFPDGNDRVWITTERRSLLLWEMSSRRLSKPSFPGLPNALTFALRDGESIWIGALDGLRRYNLRSGRQEFFSPLMRSGGATDPRVYLGWKSAAGELFFSNTLGMFRYDRIADSFEQINEFDGVFVTSMTDGADGKIWVSSYATGLFEWDPVNRKILRNYRAGDGSGLHSDKISSVFLDSSSRLWVLGFSSGIACLENGVFRVYDTYSLPTLPSNVFFTAIQDPLGAVWLSSNKGLVRFVPETGDVMVFTEFDGLLNTKLSRSLSYVPSMGILAGSDNGFVCLNPDVLSEVMEAPRIIISKMKIGDGTLPGNVDMMEAVKLGRNQDSFGLQFSVMGMDCPGGGRLRCLLEGVDHDWRDISASKAVYWFNVPAGKYRLRLSSSAFGNRWVEDQRNFEITVSPGFFGSVLGMLVTALLLGLLIALTVFLVFRNQKAGMQKEMDRELLRSKMDFFSHIVHEIKTPLTLIRTPLQSVLSKNSMDDDVRRDLQVVQSNTDYLTSLVNELLEFARVERKGYILNCEPLNLVEMISVLVFNYSEAANGKGIRLEFVCPEPQLWVNADKAAISKIINNLLINALKHAQNRIELRLAAEVGAIELEVENDGDTIPSELRESIFKPFFRYGSEDGGSSGEGFGIELSLARSLAQMHGGSLELKNCPQTVFRLALPPMLTPPYSTQTLDNEVVMGATFDERPVLLVVEDNKELRDFLARKFEDVYRVFSAPDTEAATAILNSQNVDVVLTDITMPGHDGLELCRSVRADVENSHLPIIILSARTSVESKIQAMEAGADLYIEKPFDLEYLRTSLHNIVERRKLMRKALSSGLGKADVSLFGLPKRDEEFFNTFDSFIQENIGNAELSNAQIADALCMSQSSMIRKIRKLLDTSPSNYVRDKRLGAAARMLRDSHGNNITDICYAVGFTNASYFAKCFKEKFGVTPSEYAGS